MYEPRFYRNWVTRRGLKTFSVVHRESDLLIRAERDLRRRAQSLLAEARDAIERYIAAHPDFAESLDPLPVPPQAAPIVRAMISAAAQYEVGPMAAVAGAVAAHVGSGLLEWTSDVIVENGGDLFLRTAGPVEAGLYAGEAFADPAALRLRVEPGGSPLGMCTSSGRIGHSLSFGNADAVVAVARDAALADAAATAIGNRIKGPSDIGPVLEAEKARGLLAGLVIVAGGRIGAFGAVELIR